MRFRLAVVLIMVLASARIALADVGMWIPMFIEKNIADMQKNGLKLSAEDIYSINHASLKDAVVIFGGGCTGELVSDEGLLLTNYHCGYSAIQKLSSVEHDYLTDGFWAKSREEELPCDGLKVTFLESIEDVTAQVLVGTENITDVKARDMAISDNIKDVKSKAGNDFTVEIETFYGGNQYLLFKYIVYTDVRLVGAPPSDLGKFGGDTDNWVWPRHTCDFSMFRVYADKDNKPAKLASSNVPMKPKKHLKINKDGVKEGDFTMVMGFPGSTKLYDLSTWIEAIQNVINPKNVELRTAKLEVMNKYQAKSVKVNIQYASKNAGTSNAWKKWQGEIKGLKKVNAVERKKAVEAELCRRSDKAKELIAEYGKILTPKYVDYNVARQYVTEVIARGGIELLQLVRRCSNIKVNGNGNLDAKDVEAAFNSFYKDFDYALSEEMAVEVANVYCKNMPKALWPESWRKSKAPIAGVVRKAYSKSVLRSEETAAKISKNGEVNRKKLMKDPIVALYGEFLDVSYTLKDYYGIADDADAKFDELRRLYIKEMMTAYPDSLLPSDANFTMRVSYGKVAGYEAADAVEYKYYTTLDGIIEKHNTGNPDFSLPQRLMDLYNNKAYAEYADASDGKLHTAFVATNHTTGGNSGSPVLNANGELIGLNFDRAWDGVMSDMVYNPEICRNVTLDIRYLLFVVDKYGDVKYLVDEMLND